ncbi:MAG TPA: hypothetical protein VK480_01000 [Solirubrobacterales bacterium]|nr:hypothetical protein [Solirubrobacterales bacterium]
MKYIKVLSLMAVAAAAMMALAATASAGTFASPKGTPYTGKVHAIANPGETTLHGVVTITCKSSTVEGEITTHSHTTTGSGHVSKLLFNECGENHVTVEEAGTLEAHTHSADATGETYAILTSSGAKVSIQVTSLGITCVFTTSNTEVGTVTNSTHQEKTHAHATSTGLASIPKTAVIHVDSSKIPRTGGSFFCGSSGEWTGTYEVTTPDYLDYN